jgi:TonB family protein
VLIATFATPALAIDEAARTLLAEQARPVRITNPDWVRQPSAEDISAYYPKAARRAKIQGSAAIMCEVSADGGLQRCRVISEGPEGEGFGRAALGMVGLFEMRPAMVGERPIHGGVVRIPMRFVIPENDEGLAVNIAVGITLLFAVIGLIASVLFGNALVQRRIASRRVVQHERGSIESL